MTDHLSQHEQPEPPPLADLAGRWQEPEQEEHFALPVIQNELAAVQVLWGPCGVQNWIGPPTGLPTPIGSLYMLDNAHPVPVGADGTSYRWTPWEVQRDHELLRSRVRLHPGDSAVTERLTFARAGRYALVYQGLCRTWNFADYWNLPPQDVPQHNLRADEAAVLIGDNKTFGLARITLSVPTELRVYLSFDDFLRGRPSPSGRGRVVAAIVDVTAGQEIAWTGAQGTSTAPEPQGSDHGAEEAMERFWQAAFDPDEATFTGHLPALSFGDAALDRLYYMGVWALLCGRRAFVSDDPRSRFATGGQAIWAGRAEPLPVLYTTGATEGAATTSFIWELHLVAPLLARLDPGVLRSQIEAFLAADMREHWGIDALSGVPVGMWYAINDTAIVTAAADYLELTGDLDWLENEVAGSPVRDLLLRHVRRHHTLAGGSVLADYGAAENLLECVPGYEHQVASFNAMAAWCYRYAARVLAPEDSQRLLDRATRIEQAVRDLLQPDGVFACGLPGNRRPVRTVVDFAYVGTYMGTRLDDDERHAMLAFLREELQTPDWVRALSLRDAGSMSTSMPEFQTYRADHQSTGSYDAWPAMAAAARHHLGDPEGALAWLRQMSEVTWEGPFGQAHWLGTEPGRPATKAGFINGNCYLEVCGSRFATVLLEICHPDA